MNPGVLEDIARTAPYHWWYRGLRDTVTRCLRRPGLQLRSRPRILDAGCGPGALLHFLGECLNPSYLGGFDLSREAVDLARCLLPEADIYQSDICDPDIHCQELDLIVSFDVISMTTTAGCATGLRTLVQHLAPGGLLLLNLPAFGWLMSEHDLAVHCRQRFNCREVARLLRELRLVPEILTYRLCPLLPALILFRLPSMLRRRPAAAGAKSDLTFELGDTAHQALTQVLKLENRLIARGLRMPWGTSVFAIGRKPQPDTRG